MVKVTEYVKASSIWETAEDYEYEGVVPGLVHGFNIEVRTPSGVVDWMSCSWIYDSVEEHINSDFMQWYLSERGFEFTGRVCFRGYGEEEYDFDEREYFVTKVGAKSDFN